jgi:acyl dehydratase
MALNPDGVGKEAGPVETSHTWKDIVLYALGIGATEAELDYLLDNRGPKTYPMYAVVPTFAASISALSGLQGSFANVLHGGQSFRMHKPIPANGKLLTTAKCEAMYDRRKFAQTIATTRTVDSKGEPVFDTEWSILYRGEGGFGGPPAPKAPESTPPDRAPDWVSEEATRGNQALLYRLSGDLNPLHADPKFARMVGFDQPILHGLCTFGFVGRSLIRGLCDGDGDRLMGMRCEFRKPVWPGDTIVTEAWDEGDGRVLFHAKTAERGDAVIQGGIADVRPA